MTQLLYFPSVSDSHGLQCGSGSRSGSGSRWPFKKKPTAEKKIIFFGSKNASFVPLKKGRPSYRRSLQPSKENIQNFTTQCFFSFFYCEFFLSFWIRIRIRIPNADLNSADQINPDPKHWFFFSHFFNFLDLPPFLPLLLLGLLGGWSPLVPVGPLWRCSCSVLPPPFASRQSRKSVKRVQSYHLCAFCRHF